MSELKIKITYSEYEEYKSAEIEEILAGLFSSGERVKIRKPEQNQPFKHTYITVDSIREYSNKI